MTVMQMTVQCLQAFLAYSARYSSHSVTWSHHGHCWNMPHWSLSWCLLAHNLGKSLPSSPPSVSCISATSLSTSLRDVTQKAWWCTSTSILSQHLQLLHQHAKTIQLSAHPVRRRNICLAFINGVEDTQFSVLWLSMYIWFQDGHTPMMAAAESGQIHCVRVLVNEMGCSKDAQDKVALQMCVQSQVCRPFNF